jgi:bifunctional non-homologous end joining protein LigD
VRLYTRRGYDWTDRYPRIGEAVAATQAASAVIDGEAVCCDGSGVAIFEQLHKDGNRARLRRWFLGDKR